MPLITARFADRDRVRFALRLSAGHLLASAGVAVLAALLVFVLWYPSPTAQLLEVRSIYLILLGVDVVCGPLLTLVMASPRKPRRELILDLGLVALIQLAALGYGLYSLANARPVAYVFEQDRLVLVALNELHTPECGEPCWPDQQAWDVGRYLSDPNRSGADRLQSLDLSLQGVSPAMRPSTWAEWNWLAPDLQSALRPLSALRADQQERLVALAGQAFLARSELRYLPLVSSKTLDWIAVFDDQGEWISSWPVDGFQ